MKFIHTADWHLGNRMHDIDRDREFAAFLNWLTDEIQKEKAETLIIAGDIFDTINPSNEAKRLYVSFLASLNGSCCKNIIVTGGNHDSAALLDSEKEIFSLLNIHVVGSIANIPLEDAVFELFDADGNVNAVCAAIPFVRESELRCFIDEDDDSGAENGCFSDKAYGSLYKKAYEIAEKVRGGRNIPVIATGHLYAADLEGRFENAKTENSCDDGRRVLDVVGNLGSVHAGVFPSGFDYVALGHIHYTTMVGKNPKIRYSGSPFILGFDEAALPRNVLSVEVKRGRVPIVDRILIPKTTDFRRISGDFKTIKTELEKYLDKRPDEAENETHLEIYFKTEDGINIQERLSELISKLEERKIYIASWKRQDSVNILNGMDASFIQDELRNLEPEEIFKILILSKNHFDSDGMDENQIEKKQNEILNRYLPLFNQVYAETEQKGLFDENN